MSELDALRRMLDAAPAGSYSAQALQQRIAAMTGHRPGVPQEALRSQALSQQAAQTVYDASRGAVNSDEVAAYGLTAQQAAALAQFRNERDYGSTAPDPRELQQQLAQQGYAQDAAAVQSSNAEDQRARLEQLGLI